MLEKSGKSAAPLNEIVEIARQKGKKLTQSVDGRCDSKKTVLAHTFEANVAQFSIIHIIKTETHRRRQVSHSSDADCGSGSIRKKKQ